MSIFPPRRTTLLRYCLPVVAVYAMLRSSVVLGESAGGLLLFAVLVSAWYGGLGPGLLATTVVTILSAFAAISSGKVPPPGQLLGLSLFVTLGTAVSLLVEALHASRRLAERNSEEARRNQEALRRREDELTEVDRRKNEFLAMLAHELRNPLGAISSAVQLLQATPNENDRRWSEDVINRQTRHLARLIDDLLDVTRISRGKVTIRRKPLDLRTIIGRAVDVVRPLVVDKKHDLVIETGADPLLIEGDSTRLEQVIVNLLTNAAKYTKAGGRIELIARQHGPEIVVSVRDNGVGIAPEMLSRIFEMFEQIDRTLDRSQGGLGIGLTLVRSLIELHDGRVTATSAGVGHGSEFTFRLPATGAPAAPTGEMPVFNPTVSEPATSSILIAEDNPDLAQATVKLLQAHGYQVWTAETGPDALKAAALHRPRVALLNLSLPGMNGFDLARNLRQNARLRDLTIIAVSGFADGQVQEPHAPKPSCFDHHLTKPVDTSTLLSLLDQAVRPRTSAHGGVTPSA